MTELPDNPINAHTLNRTTKITLGGHECRVEPARNHDIVQQCTRCQSYKHADTRTRPCNYAPKCMHCARQHLSTSCREDRAFPTCANCGKPGHKGKTMKCHVFRDHYYNALDKTKSASQQPPKQLAKQPVQNAWTNACKRCNTSHHVHSSCPTPREISIPLFTAHNITDPEPADFTSTRMAYEMGKNHRERGAESTTLRVTKNMSETDQRRCKEYLQGLKMGGSKTSKVTRDIQACILNDIRNKSTAYNNAK